MLLATWIRNSGHKQQRQWHHYSRPRDYKGERSWKGGTGVPRAGVASLPHQLVMSAFRHHHATDYVIRAWSLGRCGPMPSNGRTLLASCDSNNFRNVRSVLVAWVGCGAVMPFLDRVVRSDFTPSVLTAEKYMNPPPWHTSLRAVCCAVLGSGALCQALAVLGGCLCLMLGGWSQQRSHATCWFARSGLRFIPSNHHSHATCMQDVYSACGVPVLTGSAWVRRSYFILYHFWNRCTPMTSKWNAAAIGHLLLHQQSPECPVLLHLEGCLHILKTSWIGMPATLGCGTPSQSLQGYWPW